MKNILLLLTSFVSITSIICGIMLLRDPDGATLHLSQALLQHTPFKDFTLPGYLLTIIVGGSSFTAALSLFLKEKKAWRLAIVAGLTISGWIIIEIWLTRTIFWLQFVYLGTGIIILMMAFDIKPASGYKR